MASRGDPHDRKALNARGGARKRGAGWGDAAAAALSALFFAAIPSASQATASAACLAEDPGDAFRLGQLYDSGMSVRQDFATAAACYLVAAQAGHRTAQFNIGAMYDNGRGVAQDIAAAAAWYRRAAEQGDGRAAYALGLIYQKGGGTVLADRDEALNWFRAAQARGIAAAKAKIADLAPPQARPQIAAPESGLEEYQRGMALLIGPRDTRDSAAAFQWFRRGAQAGSDLAAYALAALYEQGEGTPRDEVLANAWYRVAAREFPAGRARVGAEEGVVRTAARLTPEEHGAAAAKARDILAGLESQRLDKLPSTGSSHR
jgi:TPR repeat protein